MKIILKVTFGFLLLAMLLLKVNLDELTNNVLRFSEETIFYCIIIFSLSWLVSIYKWQLLLPYIHFGRLLSVSFAGQFYSNILPGQVAGEVVKAYRLGKGREDAEHIAASVLVDKLTGLIGLLVVAAGGLITSKSHVSPDISLSIGLFTLFFVISLFCLKLPFVYRLITALLRDVTDRWPQFDSLVLRLFRLLNAWEDYLSKPFRLVYVLFFGIVFQLLCVWINTLLAHELGINVSFTDFCWIFGLVSIAVILPISIGGIGVREGVFAGTLSLQGVPIEKSIVLSFSVFAISLLGAFIGGLMEVFNSRRSHTPYTHMQSSDAIGIRSGIKKKPLQTGSGYKYLPIFLPFHYPVALLYRFGQRIVSSIHRICYEGRFMILNPFLNNFYELVNTIKTPGSYRNGAFLAITVLSVIALIYDRSFYNYSFNWADEGSVALISERLLKGEKPYIDVEIGYGILWYLPIVSLFKIFGVKFYLIRIYFLMIVFASALFAHGLMLRLTSNRLIAFSVALFILLLPGSVHKSYIPFLVISGLYVLFLFDIKTLKPRISPWLALFCNGIYLGIAYLIRGDIATVFTLLFLFYHGILALQLSIRKRSLLKLLILPVRFASVASVVFLVALPLALEADAKGYLEGFLQQYWYFAENLVSKIQQRFMLDTSGSALSAGTLLPRPSLLSFFSDDERRGFIFLTYAPVFALLSIGFFLVLDFFRERFTSKRLCDFISERTSLIVLTIGAYSTFLQFFVFRPDNAHLYSFIPGFFVLMAYFLFELSGSEGILDKFAVIRRWICYFFGAFCAIYILVFTRNFNEGPFLRKDRLSHLRLEKGIDLYVNWEKFQVIRKLNSTIRESSMPDEYVLCFPYCPWVSFITDRPTFQKYLYVDDSLLISYPEWLEEMRSEIEMKRPRAIVIQDWAINSTEISRFRNWAKPVYDYVSQKYERKLVISDFEVFVLK